MSQSAPKETPWYEDWFNSDAYEIVYNRRNLNDAEHLADLLESELEPAPGIDILDVGTGRGRHARILAKRGYRLTGLDLSEKAIETARERAESEGLTKEQIVFVQGDMRLPHFQERFDGVVNLFTSFGFFEDEHDHRRAISSMATALKPEGWLMQDFLNAPYVRERLVPESEHTSGDVHVHQKRWIEDGRVNKRILLTRGTEEYTYLESVRLLTREDLNTIYENAGLTVTGTFGDYAGNAYSASSPRLILIAAKETR